MVAQIGQEGVRGEEARHSCSRREHPFHPGSGTVKMECPGLTELDQSSPTTCCCFQATLAPTNRVSRAGRGKHSTPQEEYSDYRHAGQPRLACAVCCIRWSWCSVDRRLRTPVPAAARCRVGSWQSGYMLLTPTTAYRERYAANSVPG